MRWRKRSTANNGDQRQQKSHGTSGGSTDDLVGRLDDAVIVALDREGTFLVIGDHDLPGSESLPVPLLSDANSQAVCAAVARAIGAGNFGAQAPQALTQVRGLVRLGPETVALLKSGAQPLVRNGWNLGTLVKDGNFVHQVRWLPAETAGAASVLTAMGPAATLVAIQWQLAQIARQLERNIVLSNEILDLIRLGEWSKTQAHYEVVMQSFDHAMKSGGITTDAWSHLQDQSSDVALREARHFYLECIKRHATALSRLDDLAARRDWLVRNSEVTLRDIAALIMAERAWLVYQALRATKPGNETLHGRQLIVDDARTGLEEMLDTTAPILDAICRHFRLMEECPGGAGSAIWRRSRKPMEIANSAQVLAEQVETLGGHVLDLKDSDWGSKVAWFGPRKKQVDVLRRLRWNMERGEDLLAVRAEQVVPPFSRSYVAITNRRILICLAPRFFREGRPAREIAVDEEQALKLVTLGSSDTTDVIKHAGEFQGLLHPEDS